MRRTFIAAAAVVAVGGFISTAQAVWVDTSTHCNREHGPAPWDEAAHYMKRGYHRNVDWPWPYVCADRVAVREPFCVMVNNGWRRQNLLGAHHFNDKADQLTTAGELRVRWIMTQAPAERRGIFVERDAQSSITEQRLATAREYAAQVAIDGETPQVQESHLVSEGRPASVVDATNVRFQESMPPPTLPAATVSTETGQ
jgi:hypothetical protein